MVQNITFAMHDRVLDAGLETMERIIMSDVGNTTDGALFAAFLTMLQEVCGGEVTFYIPEDDSDRGFSVEEIH